MREHDYGSEFVIIKDGLVGVSRGRDVETRLLSVLGSGDFVGEIALLERAPRSATVTALTEVSAYVSTPYEFRGLLAQAPSLEEKIIEAELTRRAENLLASRGGAG
jgi:CRP/FNR family cyclic AMP-dependent transcriptional regulator